MATPAVSRTVFHDTLYANFRDKRSGGLQDLNNTARPTLAILLASQLMGRREFRQGDKRLGGRGSGVIAASENLVGSTGYQWNVEIETPNGPIYDKVGRVNQITRQFVDKLATAQVDFAEYTSDITIPQGFWRTALGGESKEAMKAGKAKLGKKLIEEYNAAYEKMIAVLSGHLLGAGTDETQLLSLAAGIAGVSDYSNTDTTTYAKISRSDHSVWRGNKAKLTAANAYKLSSSQHILRYLIYAIITVMINGAKPKRLFISMDSTHYQYLLETFMGVPVDMGSTNAWASLAQGNWNVNDGSNIPGFSDSDFMGLAIGPVPIVMDPDMPSGKILLIDTETTGIKCLEGSVLDVTQFTPMQGQTGLFSNLVFIGQSVVMHPRRNFAIQYA